HFSHSTGHRWSLVPSYFAKGGSKMSSLIFISYRYHFPPFESTSYAPVQLPSSPGHSMPQTSPCTFLLLFPAQSCTRPFFLYNRHSASFYWWGWLLRNFKRTGERQRGL
ncbi:unnamed protein product, partial [Ectocarpus sp. 8 AP-2014]